MEEEVPPEDDGVGAYDGGYTEENDNPYEPQETQDDATPAIDEGDAPAGDGTGASDTRPLEEQVHDAHEKIKQLTAELHTARVECKLIRHEADTYKRRLKEVLWDYLPKQRKVVEIPGVDSKCWLDEAKLQLRDYAVTHFIGSGHFGSVHAGFARESNESVALKVINKDGVMTLPDMIGVEQEIRALKCLSQHPNIVRLVEVVNAPAHIILITPYVSRGNLYQLMVEYDHLPDSEIRRLLLAITSAINYIHARNFCHRDLKPENILLDEQRNPVIIDFGLSCKMNPGQSLRSLCGTDGFIAPEMRSGKPFNPKCCDMFSLGGVLLELVLGRDSIVLLREIDPSNATDKLAKAFARVAETGRSQECQSLVHELLTDDVKRRLTAPKALAHPYVTGETDGNATPKSMGSATGGGNMMDKVSGAARGRTLGKGVRSDSQGPMCMPPSGGTASTTPNSNIVTGNGNGGNGTGGGKDSGHLYRPRSNSSMVGGPRSASVSMGQGQGQGQGQGPPVLSPSAPRPDPIDVASYAAHPPTGAGGGLGNLGNLGGNGLASPRRPSVAMLLNESELMQNLMSINMGMGKAVSGGPQAPGNGIFKSNFNVSRDPPITNDALCLGSVSAALGGTAKGHSTANSTSDVLLLPPIDR